MSDYKTGNSGSLYNYDDSIITYKCAECNQQLRDNETYEAYGKIYCGSCYQSQ
jgi:formylmethanofuran dehydrogenase subunit E